jgi:hypothetical protein
VPAKMFANKGKSIFEFFGFSILLQLAIDGQIILCGNEFFKRKKH